MKKLFPILVVVTAAVAAGQRTAAQVQPPKTPSVARITPHFTPTTRTVWMPSGEIHEYNFSGRYVGDGVFRWDEGFDRDQGPSDYRSALYDIRGNQLTGYGDTFSYGCFDGGVAICRWSSSGGEERIGILYKDMTYIELPEKYKRATDFVDGVAAVIGDVAVPGGTVSRNSYIDRTGREVYPALRSAKRYGYFPQEGYPRRLCDGLRAYYDFDSRLYGYADATGRIVIPAAYPQAGDLSNGLAPAVFKNDIGDYSWGIIDKAGKEVRKHIMPLSDKPDVPGKYKNGYFRVATEYGRSFYVDRTGLQSIDSYIFATDFEQGYAVVISSDLMGFTTFDAVVDTRFESVTTDYKKSYENYSRAPNPDKGPGIIYESGNASYFVTPGGIVILAAEHPGDLISRFGREKAAYCRVHIDGREYEGLINRAGEMTVVFSGDTRYRQGETKTDMPRKR